VIGALVAGAILGMLVAALGIGWRWWTGQPTVVTGGGWAVSPLRSGGWGLLIGSAIALLEVLYGRRLADTWGVRIVLSSLGGMLGGMLAWRVWVALSSTTTPAIVKAGAP